MVQIILFFISLTFVYFSHAMNDPCRQTQWSSQCQWVRHVTDEFSPSDSCLSVPVDQVSSLQLPDLVLEELDEGTICDSGFTTDNFVERDPMEQSEDSDLEMGPEPRRFTTADYLKAATQRARRQRTGSTTYSFGIERIKEEENKGSFKVMHGGGTVIFSPENVYCVDNNEQKRFLSVKQLEEWADLFKTVRPCSQDGLVSYLQYNRPDSTVSQLEQVKRFCEQRDALLAKTFSDEEERKQYAQVLIRILFSFCTYRSPLSVLCDYTPVQAGQSFDIHEDSQGHQTLILYPKYADNALQRVPRKTPLASTVASAAASSSQSPDIGRRIMTSPTKSMKPDRFEPENPQFS